MCAGKYYKYIYTTSSFHLVIFVTFLWEIFVILQMYKNWQHIKPTPFENHIIRWRLLQDEVIANGNIRLINGEFVVVRTFIFNLINAKMRMTCIFEHFDIGSRHRVKIIESSYQMATQTTIVSLLHGSLLYTFTILLFFVRCRFCLAHNYRITDGTKHEWQNCDTKEDGFIARREKKVAMAREEWERKRGKKIVYETCTEW